MFIRNYKRRGFTLLEVMLAVGVLALVGLGIYRFVETTLSAVRVSSESGRECSLVTAFDGYLRGQLRDLPVARAGVLSGEPHGFNGVSSDELRWIARPGSGLLTRHATGEWIVTLTAKQLDHGEYELGMRRQDLERKRDADWLPLFRGVRGFEVRYFDPLRKQWMEKWTDPQRCPALVRVKLWRDPESAAYEVVLPLAGQGNSMGGGA